MPPLEEPRKYISEGAPVKKLAWIGGVMTVLALAACAAWHAMFERVTIVTPTCHYYSEPLTSNQVHKSYQAYLDVMQPGEQPFIRTEYDFRPWMRDLLK